jgi:hypothetical protein
VRRTRPALIAMLAASAVVIMAGRPAGAGGGLPAVGTDAASVDLRNVPGSTPYGNGWAVPLRGAKPAWLSSDLEQQVLAANGAPLAAPLDAPLPSEIGIRPGSWEISPYGCTMNFIFSSGSTLGIGTAGHCVDKVGQHVILLTLAPGGANPVLVDIGPVVARHETGIGDDFALISINPVLYPWVDATTAVVAGPCGQFTGSGPQTVWHYGHGLAIGTGGTPRAGVALTWKADAYGWDGLAIFGDSGSPVRVTDLKAAGNLTHLVVDSKWLPSFIAGTRISKMLQIAGGWSLKNSSLCL